jgi:hypothetical protein
MALHPEPNPQMLLPFMHPNISNIARTWVAKTILTGHFDPSPFTNSYMTNPLLAPIHLARQQSHPFSLINWSNPNHLTLEQPSKNPKVNYRQATLTSSNTSFKLLQVNKYRTPQSTITDRASPNSLCPAATISLHTGNPPATKTQQLLQTKPIPQKEPSNCPPKLEKEGSCETGDPATYHKKTKNTKKAMQHSKTTVYKHIYPKITDHMSTPTSSTRPFTPGKSINASQIKRLDIQVPYTQVAVSSANPTIVPSTAKAKALTTAAKLNNTSTGKPKYPKICIPKLRISEFMTTADNKLACPTLHAWGHELESIDTSKTIRIILQNPNGIKLNPLDMGDFAYSLHLCKTLGAGVISLSESNVNWNQTQHLGRVSKIICDIWPTTSLQHSQHPEPFSNPCQRGGTLQVLTDRWVSRLLSKGMDPYGLGR